MIQYNLTNNNLPNDLTTEKTVAAGSNSYVIDLSELLAISLQIVYNNTDAANDTFKLYGSDDGVNFYDYPNAATINTSITAVPVSNGWQTDYFKSRYLKVVFTKVGSTTGTYKLILTTREND